MALVSRGASAPFATMQPVSVSHAKILPSAWMPHEIRSLSSGENARHATPSSCSDSLNFSFPVVASHSTTSAFTPSCPVAMRVPDGETAKHVMSSSCPQIGRASCRERV